MQLNKRVKVIGGFYDNEGGGELAVFIEKKSVVVEEQNLGVLFRRDAALCGMPIIKIQETLERCTPGLFFSNSLGG